MGLIALSRGRPDEALKLVQEAQAYADERQMQHFNPLIALSAARIHTGRGEREQALIHYERAEAVALRLQMLPSVWQAQAGAAQVLGALGRIEEAGEKRRAARAIVDEIAGRFRDPILRDAFVASSSSALYARRI